MIEQGSSVYHQDFGTGKVESAFGSYAKVNFFGEILDVKSEDLQVVKKKNIAVVSDATFDEQNPEEFRQAFEAVNLGVVPTNHKQIVKLTIGGEKVAKDIVKVLKKHKTKGVNNCFMGYYGSGKSHHLQLVKSIAIQEGWVTSLIEIDPKAVDPAKPSTVYREIMANLDFPPRQDGKQNVDFFDLVKEIRDNWINVKRLKYFQKSPWFNGGMSVLYHRPHHRHNQDYVSGVNWLSGQSKNISAIRSAKIRGEYSERIPAMPQTMRSGYVYAYHLVVINEVLRFLGYKGLLVILDEVEHIRGYSAIRKDHATHFIQTLKSCAQKQKKGDVLRVRVDEYNWSDMPSFWNEGPHFGLFAGLTEGFAEDSDYDLEIDLFNKVTKLKLPSSKEYSEWVNLFLTKCGDRFGTSTRLLKSERTRAKLCSELQINYENADPSEKVLRNWTKLAGLPAAILLSNPRNIEEAQLVEMISKSATEIAGERFPWDD